ncbi:unnamed protein product, partial [Meganyctiphanes norvegica]
MSPPVNYIVYKFFQEISLCRISTSGIQHSQSEVEHENLEDDPKDRSKVIPIEISMKYLESEAYETTYGDDPVWTKYRRNFKGQFPPTKTRQKCIRKDRISTGNPCPICRDEYLVVEYRNTKLLEQFISDYTGEVISFKKTGVCQKRHRELQIAIAKAMDFGLITFDVPFREYDYSEFYNVEETS